MTKNTTYKNLYKREFWIRNTKFLKDNKILKTIKFEWNLPVAMISSTQRKITKNRFIGNIFSISTNLKLKDLRRR